MIKLKNIHPLSDFLRNAKARLAQLKKSGEPAVLTVNGQAEAVVLSAEAYQKLIEELDLQRTLNTVHQGALESLRSQQLSSRDLQNSLKSLDGTAPIPADQAFAELDRRTQPRRRKKAS